MPDREALPRLSPARAEIWKFVLAPWQPTQLMPAGARLIHAHEQNGEVCVWAEVDPDAQRVLRNVMAVPTGGHPGERVYIGTVHLVESRLVFHIYDGGEVGADA